VLAENRQVLRRADAGDHVLALGIDQILAVKDVLAGRRIAGEGDAGGAIVAHVAEDHRLHVDRGAPIRRQAVQAPVGDRPRVHPRAEDGADGRPQLIVGVLRKRLAGDFDDPVLVAGDDGAPIAGVEFGIQLVALVLFVQLEDLFQVMVLDAEHHVAEHLDEAPVAVVGEARVAGLPRQADHRVVVEPQVEHRIHHPRHRGAGAGAHRDQQRIAGIAKAGANPLLDPAQGGRDFFLQIGGIGPSVGEIGVADLGGDGEAGRHRQTQGRHLGQIGALAAEQIAHLGAAVRLAAAELVDPLRHRSALPLDLGKIRDPAKSRADARQQTQAIGAQLRVVAVHSDAVEEIIDRSP